MREIWLRHKGTARFIILNVLVAIAYLVSLNFSLRFEAAPGTVASVWFPSGITLGLFLIYGDRIVVGIVFGSLWGVSADLFSGEPRLSIFSIILVNIACALGNILQPLIATYLIQKYTKNKNIFNDINSVLVYIAAAIFSPSISASLGITSLCLVGTMIWTNYGSSWLTWWLASALAHLIFTPALVLVRDFFKKNIQYDLRELGLILTLFTIVSWIIFIQRYPLAYLLLLLLIWTVFRYGSFISSLLVAIVSLMAIFSTGRGFGLHIESSGSATVLLLQSFMGVFSLTSLILSAAIEEKKIAQLSLKKTLENSENLVTERTIELQKNEELLKAANLELQKLINIDSLTKIANRRCFDERLEYEWERLCREQQPLSLLLLDVDYFKYYNDFYGHQMGDFCLTKIAQTIQIIIHRSADLVARYGGEEFVIILPNTNEDGAKIVAEKIRSAIMDLRILHEKSQTNGIITISIGVVSLFPNLLQDSSVLVQQADQALYSAKKQGRNRVICFPN